VVRRPWYLAGRLLICAKNLEKASLRVLEPLWAGVIVIALT